MSQKCSFALCSKCVNGSCELSQNLMCEYAIQQEIIHSLVPGLIHAHKNGNDNFFDVKAGIASTFCRWSGDKETAETILKLLKGENNNDTHTHKRQKKKIILKRNA